MKTKPNTLRNFLLSSLFMVFSWNSYASNGSAEPQPTDMNIVGLMDVSVQPTPSREAIHLHFSLAEIKDLRIELRDGSGQLAIEPINMETPVGPNDLEIPCSMLPNGNYLLNIKSHDGEHACKVDVLH